jgi:lipopolysaccharide transport system ATP-binding protein
VLVTHDLSAVKALCQRTLVLHRGQPVFLGDSTQAVARYHEVNQVRGAPITEGAVALAPVVLPPGTVLHNWSSSDEIGSREAELICVEVLDATGRPRREFSVGEQPRLRFYLKAQQPLEGVHFTLQVSNRHGLVLYAITTMHLGHPASSLEPGRLYRCDVRLRQSPGRGDFLIDAGLCLGDRGDGAPLHHLHRVGSIVSLSFRPAGSPPPFLGPANYDAEVFWAEGIPQGIQPK